MSGNNIVSIKGGSEAPKSARKAMETRVFTLEEVSTWILPPFQRELRVNKKVEALAAEIRRDGGIIPGIITLGRIPGERRHYLVDGQHRREAFKMSGEEQCLVDVRLCNFDTMAEMAEEYVELNSSLVTLRPDDILKGLQESIPALGLIREACPYVGYSQIRRGGTQSPVIGMSSLIRSWAGSGMETPTSGASYGSAATMVAGMDDLDTQRLIAFMQTARSAWGTDPEYFRLWGGLNLTMCMWLWRRLVIDRERGVKRFVTMTPEQFKRCLMSVSASRDYIDWLVGRTMGNRDRAPAYTRLKVIFSARLRDDVPGIRPQFPQTAWAS